MKQFNIKVAGRFAIVFVDNPRFFIGDPKDYPKIIVRQYWTQMSSEKANRILSNSINIKALKRALIARRIVLGLSMDKINSITKDNFVSFGDDIIW